jgi:hypothetical protein
MTLKEQIDRMNAVAKARTMFPEERNISVAFARYMETLEEVDRLPVVISSKDMNKPLSLIDLEYIRPACPDCSEPDMRLGLLSGNKEGYKTYWQCIKCGVRYYSTDDYTQTLVQLERKEK